MQATSTRTMDGLQIHHPTQKPSCVEGDSWLVLKDQHGSSGLVSGFLSALARLIVRYAPINPLRLEFL